MDLRFGKQFKCYGMPSVTLPCYMLMSLDLKEGRLTFDDWDRFGGPSSLTHGDSELGRNTSRQFFPKVGIVLNARRGSGKKTGLKFSKIIIILTAVLDYPHVVLTMDFLSGLKNNNSIIIDSCSRECLTCFHCVCNILKWYHEHYSAMYRL